MRLIGIKGRLHSGKDTALSYIRDAAGSRALVRREGFADRMKLSGLAALGFPLPDDIDEALALANAIKETGTITTTYIDDYGDTVWNQIDGRQWWQRYGTEAHRDIFEQEFWVNVLLPQPSNDPEAPCRIYENSLALRQKFPSVDVLVITDCRFPNEADRILRLGGEVWMLDAEKRLGPLPPGSHISEHPLPSHLVTCTIPNNGSLEQFEAAIHTAYDLAPARR